MASQTIPRKLRTAEVARLEGVSTRCLFDRVRRGEFPRPDYPAERRGAPSYWLETTVAAARGAVSAAPRTSPDGSPRHLSLVAE